MRFAVSIVSPPGYVHSASFKEVAEALHYGLRSLGHDSVLTTKIARRARELIDRPDERARLASRGFHLMQARPIAAQVAERG